MSLQQPEEISLPLDSILEPLHLGNLTLGADNPLFILGPCVIEGYKPLLRAAKKIYSICQEVGVSFIFKASYDKANRTSGVSYRGVGAREGCEMLAEVGASIGVPVTTDIHSPEEAAIASPFIDLLQIPAFLCRQTDLIEAAAHTGRMVNVKKGQFLAPWDLKPIAHKLEAAGCHRYFFTERGTTFGYNNLVVDMRSLYWIREAGYRVVFDATHAVQRPGGGGDRTTGDGILAPVLARAAMAAGVDGIFLETHEDPEKAPSDGPNQIPHAMLPKVLRSLMAIHQTLKLEDGR
ncbi:MAG TPA: 3-deoxy-8-phosphooctulonate synthase [Chthoniobacterales bacterium]|nr:3-deoxy-8-phosphooctulonate synthase [Chthoniobacterales bacterium]